MSMSETERMYGDLAVKWQARAVENKRRAEAAEAETAALRAQIEKVEALADETDGGWPYVRTERIRDALAGAPAVTPTETQAEGGA